MRRPTLLLLCLVALPACRDYNLVRHISNQRGLVPPDQFARYGREQAISVAIGREFARPYNSGSAAQADIAVTYAQQKFSADIVNITPDAQSHRITVTFKSGWRTAIIPIDDGKTGDETKIPS
jgi:hypothetical protein